MTTIASDLNNDPANVAAVSGFYGPGAWAAYICSLTSTWYTTIYQPDSAGLSDLIVALLYVNWAAIDLLVNVTTKNLKTSYASVAAASTATMWGVQQITMQVALCSHTTRLSKNAKHRLVFGIVGMFLPLIAAVWITWDTIITRNPRSLPPGIHGSDLEPWYSAFDEDVSVIFGFNFYGIGTALACANLWRMRPGLRAFFCTCASCSLFALASYISFQHSPNFIRACAPQIITEPDQAFALLCGITALLYVIAPDVWLRLTGKERREEHRYELLSAEEPSTV